MAKLRVLVADKHGLVREGICALLRACQEIEVVGEANDGQETLAVIAREDPDVALVDVALPVIDGASVTRRLRSENKKTKVLFLGENADKECIMRGIKAGGDGYILRGCNGQDLVAAIMTVYQGGYFLSPSAATKVVEEYLSVGKTREGNIYDRLNDREKDVLKLVAEGKRRYQIAEILGESTETVQRQRANLMKKLAIHSQAELVKYALREHLIDLNNGS